MREEEQVGSGLLGVAFFLGILVVFLTLVVALVVVAFWRSALLITALPPF